MHPFAIILLRTCSRFLKKLMDLSLLNHMFVFFWSFPSGFKRVNVWFWSRFLWSLIILGVSKNLIDNRFLFFRIEFFILVCSKFTMKRFGALRTIRNTFFHSWFINVINVFH